MRRQLANTGAAGADAGRGTAPHLSSLRTVENALYVRENDIVNDSSHVHNNNGVFSRFDSNWEDFTSSGLPKRRRPVSLRQKIKMAWFFVRRPSRVWRTRIRAFWLVVLILLLIDSWRIVSYKPQGMRIKPDELVGKKPRIFIASIHRHTEPILRSSWTKAILDLAEYLGPENLYVSIYESGSIVDNTKAALAELDMMLEHLKVQRNITIDPLDQLEEVARVVEQKEDDWIWTPREKYELRRIPYLSRLRNLVMEKLYEQERKGEMYDYVLWVNDVTFNTEDIVTLLSTNDGIFDAVCGMDYKLPHLYYDTFALRDYYGSKALPITWPYFTYNPSRKRLVALEPVPVKSCWNGIVAFKTAPFYAKPPLKFRGIPDSLASYHLEGSECCLIHADNNGTHSGNGVFLNPNVRVGYSKEAYDAVNPASGSWPGAREKVTGIWRNRWQRWLAWPKRRLELSTVRSRIKEWQDVKGYEALRVQGEAEHCLINEMQVLESAGWRHL